MLEEIWEDEKIQKIWGKKWKNLMELQENKLN